MKNIKLSVVIDRNNILDRDILKLNILIFRKNCKCKKKKYDNLLV